MKHWIASFFLLIFSFQIMPVKEVGKLLFKNQLTEEIHEHEKEEGDCSQVPSKLKKEGDPNEYFTAPLVSEQRVYYVSHCVDLALANSHRPRHLFTPEILTPPPNHLG